ncbi:MAG: hypothetical protein QXT45_04270 [Candidatus Bilamarchaeaceae archaeon]
MSRRSMVITTDEMSQTIPESWIGKRLPDSLAYEIAYEIREYIKSRTASGLGLGGVEFNPNVYSESYQESELFKAFNKTPSPVNMRLTGDMLNSVRIDVNDGLPQVILDDPDVTPRGHGHQTGQNGKGPLPKRPWFGITREEFTDQILPKFKELIENAETPITADKITYDLDDILKGDASLPINKIIKLIK